MKIVLYTYQNKEAVDILKKTGVLRLKKEDEYLTSLANHQENAAYNFKRAFDFVIYSMRKRLAPPKNSDTYYPIWAWQKIEGSEVPSKLWDDNHHGKIRLKISIDEERFLASDFDMFCFLLAGGLYFDINKKEHDKYENKIFEPDEFYYPNYENMFILHRKRSNRYAFNYKHETIQATFWELFIEDVIEMVEV